MAERKGAIKVNNPAMAIAVGLIVGIIATLIGSAVLAGIINAESVSEDAIGYGALVILLVSSAVGAAISAGLVGEKRLIVCLISGGVYFLFLLACTALFFDGQYQGVGAIALVILAGSFGVALLGINKGKSRYRSRQKIRNR